MLDLVVVGAGPAGLTAALYAGRSKIKTVVLEKMGAGGQLLLTETIENYPGIYRMNSFEWIETAKKQIAELPDVELREEARVDRIEKRDDFFRVFLSSLKDSQESILDAKCVVVAAGARPKRLEVPGESILTGRGVSYCATCDGPLFKNKNIVVVGGGDTAIEEALYLTRFAHKVTVIHRREELRASAILQERALHNEKIEFKWGYTPVEIVGKAKVEGIKIKNGKTPDEEILSCDGIFIFIGFKADVEFLKGMVEFDQDGFIVTDEEMMTSCDGIFACGDCRVRPFKQVVTACSEGAVAAYHIEKFLEDKI